MRDIKVGENYYFNNGKVTILRIENNEFVLVCGDINLHTEVNGSEFCHMCMVGGKSRHTCSDVDNVIEEIIEDLSDKNIFWVNVKHLKDKPFEYQKWEKITAENEELQKSVDNLKLQKLEVLKSTKEIEEKREIILEEISNLEIKKQELLEKVEETEKLKLKLVADKEGIITLSNSNIKFSIKEILRLLESSIMLEHLERGGVDNWEWYSESLPNNVEEKAIEDLFNRRKNI